MENYREVLKKILEQGVETIDRTKVGTKSIFTETLRYKLDAVYDNDGHLLVNNFPAVTSKKLAFKSVVSELLWFLEGSTDERRLAEILYKKPRTDLNDKKTIWSGNAEAFNQGGELGPVYGKQWRDWNGIDQIQKVIDLINNDPYSRRILFSAWNVSDLDKMALPPCHILYQFKVIPHPITGKPEKLNLICFQRSCDMFLGVPFDIASGTILLSIISSITGLFPNEYVWTGVDCHVYNNHIDAVKEQLARPIYPLPTLQLPIIKNLSLETIKGLCVDDFKLLNYTCNDTIKAPMAV